MALDLYKLEYLIAIAEEGSFTRAAGRLHLSQQALSASMRALEREVGVDLIERSGNSITVLPAGDALIADARVLRGVARSALLRARRIGRGQAETLRVGHTPAITGAEVTALLRPFQHRHWGLSAEVNQRYPHELTQQLLGGDLDLGLCRGLIEDHGLTYRTVAQHQLRVAVAADHHLAARSSVQLSDLADEEIMVWGRPGRSRYTDLLIGKCRDAGFEPRVQRNPIQGTPPVTAVIGTAHVALVTAEPGPTAESQVRVLDLQPPTLVPVHALWPRHSSSEAREKLLDALDDEATE